MLKRIVRTWLYVAVLLSGCWPYRVEPEPTIPAVRRASRPRQMCKKLTTIAGDVPVRPDLDERCGHHDEAASRYWCESNELGWYAGSMRWWIGYALAACRDEDDTTTAAEARAK